MNIAMPICKFCHGTANALTALVPNDRGGMMIYDPKRIDGRFVPCGACGGTGLMPELNHQIVALLTELAGCPLEFLDELDDDGLPVENPEYHEEDAVEQREQLISTARELLARLRLPLKLRLSA